MGGGHKCFVISEVGVNHNGDLDLAAQLIDVSVEAGADAVKFQTFRTDDLILPEVEKADYQKLATGISGSQTSMLRGLEVGEDFHLRLMEMCSDKGILYLSTPYDPKSLDFLVSQGVPAIKVASTDSSNLLYLEQVATKGLPVLLSTGMASYSEIGSSLAVLRSNGCDQIILLHCTSLYPTMANEVNLRTIGRLSDEFRVPIGFSDHTTSIGAAPYAVALGACVIEKHVTLDRAMEGPDHHASVEPDDFIRLVSEVRKVEAYLGSSNDAERPDLEIRRSLQRSFVARRRLMPGDEIIHESVTTKRAGGVGIPGSEWLQIRGKFATVVIEENQVIHHDYLRD